MRVLFTKKISASGQSDKLSFEVTKFGPIKHEARFRPCWPCFSLNWGEARGFSLLGDGYSVYCITAGTFQWHNWSYSRASKESTSLLWSSYTLSNTQRVYGDHRSLFSKLHWIQCSRRGLFMTKLEKHGSGVWILAWDSLITDHLCSIQQLSPLLKTVWKWLCTAEKDKNCGF